MRVIIVGGGFGGLNVAKYLGNKKNIQVTLIDRRNHHLFQPLLYQVATAGLSPAEIATPIRSILASYKNITTYLAEAQHIDQQNSVLKTDFQDFSYEYLVLACGAQHSYFGHTQWENIAPGLKTLEQAREIRRRVFLAFEQAERSNNKPEIRSLLTFVVIGAGPTGVELAGALGEISRFALSREFSHIDPSCTRIILLEAGNRILPSFNKLLAQKAAHDLESLGVQIWTKCPVTNLEQGVVHIGSERINAQTVLWAAGVKPALISKSLNTQTDHQGKIIVKSDLSIINNPNIFVIGDMAHVKNSAGTILPGVAAVAIQQGKFVARAILRDQSQKKREKFSYSDRGQMATIGRGRAIAEFGKLKSTGFLAWVLWLLVHIYYLIGFRNRLFVMIQWAIAFFTFKRGARIIQNPEWRSPE